MGDDLVIVLEFHPEGGVGEEFVTTPGNSSISSFAIRLLPIEIRRRMVGRRSKSDDSSRSKKGPPMM
jgi:hypothetical protein